MRHSLHVFALIVGLTLCCSVSAHAPAKCWKCGSTDVVGSRTTYLQKSPETVRLVSSSRKRVRLLDGTNSRKRTGRFVYSPGSHVSRVKEPISAETRQILRRGGIELDKEQRVLPPVVKTITASRHTKQAVYRVARVKTHSYAVSFGEKHTYFCTKCGSVAGMHKVPLGTVRLVETRREYDYEARPLSSKSHASGRRTPCR